MRDNRQGPAAIIETWLSTTPYVTAKLVSLSCVFIWMLGLLFSRGTQIYPIFNDVPPEMASPECRVLNDVKATITERQVRLSFTVDTELGLTRQQAWRLIRIRVHGPHFSHEMRPIDNCGVYTIKNERVGTALHYELIQEGPTTVEVLCLDQPLLNVSGVTQPWKRETPYSIVHQNETVENVCINNQLVLFSMSLLRDTVKTTWLGSNITVERKKMKEYSDYITVHDQAVVFDLKKIGLEKLNVLQVFERILAVAYVQSQNDQFLLLENTQPFPDHFLSVVKRITGGRVTTERRLCFGKLNFNADIAKANTLNNFDYEAIRNAVTSRYENMTSNIVMNPVDFGSVIRDSFENVVDLTNEDIKYTMKNVSVAKAMIAIDDNNKVMNALWLSPDSPLILVVPPKRTVYSQAVQHLQRAKKKIILVEGDVDGAMSDDQVTLHRCLIGELDVNGSECAKPFASIKYTVNVSKVLDIVKGL